MTIHSQRAGNGVHVAGPETISMPRMSFLLESHRDGLDACEQLKSICTPSTSASNSVKAVCGCRHVWAVFEDLELLVSPRAR